MNPKYPPGYEVLESTVLHWLFEVLRIGSVMAFLVVGGIFLFAYLGGHGSERAIRSLIAVCIGTVLIAFASNIAAEIIPTAGRFTP